MNADRIKNTDLFRQAKPTTGGTGISEAFSVSNDRSVGTHLRSSASIGG
jgi:hypothetical protein